MDDKQFRCSVCHGSTGVRNKNQPRFWHSSPEENSHNRGCMVDCDGIKTPLFNFKGFTHPSRLTEEEKDKRTQAKEVKKRAWEEKAKAKEAAVRVQKRLALDPSLTNTAEK
jgi:hypothetical protein